MKKLLSLYFFLIIISFNSQKLSAFRILNGLEFEAIYKIKGKGIPFDDDDLFSDNVTFDKENTELIIQIYKIEVSVSRCKGFKNIGEVKINFDAFKKQEIDPNNTDAIVKIYSDKEGLKYDLIKKASPPGGPGIT